MAARMAYDKPGLSVDRQRLGLYVLSHLNHDELVAKLGVVCSYLGVREAKRLIGPDLVYSENSVMVAIVVGWLRGVFSSLTDILSDPSVVHLFLVHHLDSLILRLVHR